MIVLSTLILVATVANLNLSVANVALPDIGRHFDASQVALNVVAVGFSLGLAATVLWLGALGDRYGRRRMLLLGTALSIPACLLAAYAPSIAVLAIARILGGVAAGMAFPTTLALVTALWSGSARTRSIALWSGIGGAASAIGPLTAGALLEHFWWGSIFLITLPLAIVALVMAWFLVPAHVNETTDKVDNFGGLLSVVMVGSVVIAINFAPQPGMLTATLIFAVIGIGAIGAFVLRQRRVRIPLYDLSIARRRTFWVAAVAGIMVFGALMGAMFIGQQYLQNVLGYSSFQAGAAILPTAVFMVLSAPVSARLIERHGSRVTLLIGYVAVGCGFLIMWFGWGDDTPYVLVGAAYACLGIGVGIAGAPASRSLTDSVPVSRAGMASGTADLQRDLGGAVMQSILGAILTAGYAASFNAKVADAPTSVSQDVIDQLTKSYAGAESIAAKYPQYSDQIVAAARDSFVHGQDMAFAAGVVTMLLGTVLVWFAFPDRRREIEMLAEFEREDSATRNG